MGRTVGTLYRQRKKTQVKQTDDYDWHLQVDRVRTELNQRMLRCYLPMCLFTKIKETFIPLKVTEEIGWNILIVRKTGLRVPLPILSPLPMSDYSHSFMRIQTQNNQSKGAHTCNLSTQEAEVGIKNPQVPGQAKLQLINDLVRIIERI